MAESSTTEAMPVASRVVEDTAEDEIDLTQDPVTWTAPKPEAKPTAAKRAKPMPKAPRRGGTPVVGAILGFAGILVVLLLLAMTAVLWSRVDGLEDQVDGRTLTEQSSADRPTDAQLADIEEQVVDLRAAVDALTAAQAGDAPGAPVTPNAEIAAVTARLDATIACLNTYMDTVAQATNTNASYTYVPC